MNKTYYDIGVNLFCRQFPDPEQIVREAYAAGVVCILTGTDPKENRRIDRFLRNRDVYGMTGNDVCSTAGHDAYGTAGIHPHNADSAQEADFTEIERLILENPRIVAVGECGLDFDRMFSSKENQIRCLERHIALAERLGKPLFLHERAASDAFIQIFEKHPEICKKSVVHCFTGDEKTVRRYLSMGFSIGITGWICDDRRAEPLRKAVKEIPLDRILLETDAPYLTPRNVKGLGRVNVPQNIVYVAQETAKYMGVPVEEVTAHARENTQRLFGIRE